MSSPALFTGDFEFEVFAEVCGDSVADEVGGGDGALVVKAWVVVFAVDAAMQVGGTFVADFFEARFFGFRDPLGVAVVT